MKQMVYLFTNQSCPKRDDETRATFSSIGKVAISWILDCVANHKDCLLNRTWLTPTRSIAIGESEDFSDVRLCSGFVKASNVRYATLSPCWGPKGLSYKLNSASERQFSEQLPWLEMPQTFICSRRLGSDFDVEYIWIDTLCIIQESKQAWQQDLSTIGTLLKTVSATLHLR